MSRHHVLPAGISIIKHESDLNDKGTPFGRFVEQTHEFKRCIEQSGEEFKDGYGGRQRLDDMRRIPDQPVALLHRFTNQAEFTVLQIADPAMSHVRRCRTGA